MYIITKEVAVGQVLYEFQETFEHNLSHFNVERIQQREFLNDLQNPGSYITQTDFAQAYQLSYKRRQWEHLRVEEVKTNLPLLSTTREKQSQCFILPSIKAKTNL